MCWEVSACRETNPFRTATPCWRRLRLDSRGLKTLPPAQTAPARWNASDALGCAVERGEDGSVMIEGLGPQLKPPSEALDCGNSGSTMRMLSGILAAQPFSSELIGDASLSRRPMKRIIEPLSQMGAQIDSDDGHAPLRISGARLRGITYRPPVASAQVKTCLLFAGLLADGTTAVEEAHATRDHGELALRAFGAELERSRNHGQHSRRPEPEAAGGLCAGRQLIGRVLPVCRRHLSRVEPGARRSAAESHALGSARCAHGDGLPRFHAARRRAAWRTGRHDRARARARGGTW